MENWINKNEQLPDEQQVVLGVSPDNRVLPMKYYMGRFYRFIDYSDTDRVHLSYYYPVIYWQPLPLPPQTP